MASAYTPPVQSLIDELGGCQALARSPRSESPFICLRPRSMMSPGLAHAITDAKARVRFCARCFNFAEAELCPICLDDRRSGRILCVVEEARDIVALEKTGEFHGRYHVLLGAMSPLEGIGPEH